MFLDATHILLGNSIGFAAYELLGSNNHPMPDRFPYWTFKLEPPER
jgi:hypothetical protein